MDDADLLRNHATQLFALAEKAKKATPIMRMN